MRLLFDQNLSPRLPRRLADLYPGSAHVREFDLEAADDEAVWERAARSDFIIVTKDDDFRQRSFLMGAPPKVIWVRLGNCTTLDIESLLRGRSLDVLAFSLDVRAALLVLRRAGRVESD